MVHGVGHTIYTVYYIKFMCTINSTTIIKLETNEKDGFKELKSAHGCMWCMECLKMHKLNAK